MKYGSLLLITLLLGCRQEHESLLNIYQSIKAPPTIASLSDSVVMLELNEQMRCSGVAISNNFILSASHCLENYTHPSDYRIVTNQGQMVPIKTIYSPVYQGESVYEEAFPNFDILLLELQSPLELTKFAALGDDATLDSELAYIAGYGRSEVNDRSLRFGRVLVTSMQADLKRANLRVIPDDSRPCDGDSGGPLFIESSGQVYLMGVTHGLNPFINGIDFPSPDCSYRETSYTSVAFHRDWIRSIVFNEAATRIDEQAQSFVEYCHRGLQYPKSFAVLKSLGQQLDLYDCSSIADSLQTFPRLDFRNLKRPDLGFLQFGGHIDSLVFSNAKLPGSYRFGDLEVRRLIIEEAEESVAALLTYVNGLVHLDISGVRDGETNLDVTAIESQDQLHTVRLTRLGLHDAKFLRHLNMVSELDLSHNFIEKLDFLTTGQPITYLNLSHNQIDDVSPVSQLIDLKVGIFNNNTIHQSADFSMLRQAEVLSFVGAIENEVDIKCPDHPDFEVCIF